MNDLWPTSDGRREHDRMVIPRDAARSTQSVVHRRGDRDSGVNVWKTTRFSIISASNLAVNAFGSEDVEFVALQPVASHRHCRPGQVKPH